MSERAGSDASPLHTNRVFHVNNGPFRTHPVTLTVGADFVPFNPQLWGEQRLNRNEFNDLRDLDAKRIDANIIFSPRKQHPSILSAEGIVIVNEVGVDAVLEIHYNPESDSKVFSVMVPSAGGQICRLCVDGNPHPPCGRSHKHSLGTPECPKQNLKSEVVDLPALAGKPIDELFEEFCRMAKIQFNGEFNAPRPNGI
jgi:hypothetical protein